MRKILKDSYDKIGICRVDNFFNLNQIERLRKYVNYVEKINPKKGEIAKYYEKGVGKKKQEILMRAEYFYDYHPGLKNLINSKKITFTYKKKISDIIKIINQSDIIIGNESGPVCLGSSLKKKVHAIYLPIHTKPESKIIYKKNIYYNAKKLGSKKIINKILKSIWIIEILLTVNQSGYIYVWEKDINNIL